MPRSSANCSDSRKLRFAIPNRHPHQPGPNTLVPAAGSRSSDRFTGRFPDLAYGQLLKQRRKKPTEMSPYSLVAQDPLPLAAPDSAGSSAEVSSDPFCDQPEVVSSSSAAPATKLFGSRKVGANERFQRPVVEPAPIVPVSDLTDNRFPVCRFSSGSYIDILKFQFLIQLYIYAITVFLT